MNSTTFLASTKSDEYVLTVFQDKAKLENFPLLLQCHAILDAAGFPIPILLAHGNLFEQEFLLTTYLSGKVKNIYQKEAYEKLGFLLGNMHLSLQAFDCKAVESTLVVQLRKDYEEIIPHIPKDFSLLGKHLSHLEAIWPDYLPKGLIHGDIWSRNILFDGVEISAVLDFTSATVDLLLFDLAGLFKTLYFSPDGEEHLETLLSAYQTIRPFHPDELEHISTMIIAKMLHTILYMLKKTLSHPEQKSELYGIATMNLMKLEHSYLYTRESEKSSLLFS